MMNGFDHFILTLNTTHAVKKAIIGMTLAEMYKEMEHLKIPKYAIREIALWVYRRRAIDFEAMSNISKQIRAELAREFEIGYIAYMEVTTSIDGTRKYVFPTHNKHYIETAYIPDKKRNTLCISTQMGCKMGCSFCLTGKQGFQGNLSSRDILNQILSLPEYEKLTNIVVMGMGEPLDNINELLRALEIITSDYGMTISPRKITVSTIGLLSGIEKFIEMTQCNLAISLHNPFHEERLQLMPVEKKDPIESVICKLKQFQIKKQRRISFEYILFKNLNDSQRHVNGLASLLNGLRCKINLIRYHNIPECSLKGSNEEELLKFQFELNKKGIPTTIRVSRGQDIRAACGLLSTKYLLQNN